MSKVDLLHHGQAESSSLLVRGEVGLKNFLTLFGWHAGAVVANFENRAASVFAIPCDFDFAATIGGLDGIEKQVEKALAKQLFVGLDGGEFFLDAQAKHFFFEVELE